MYEHNIVGITSYIGESQFEISFNFTYIDNKSSCDCSDIKNALLKNPSINVWGHQGNNMGQYYQYFVDNLRITQSPLSQDTIIITLRALPTNDGVSEFESISLFNVHVVDKVPSSTLGTKYALIKYITTNKITNLY